MFDLLIFGFVFFRFLQSILRDWFRIFRNMLHIFSCVLQFCILRAFFFVLISFLLIGPLNVAERVLCFRICPSVLLVYLELAHYFFLKFYMGPHADVRRFCLKNYPQNGENGVFGINWKICSVIIPKYSL